MEKVPFYMRAGKCLKRKNSEIVIVFKDIAKSMFDNVFPKKLGGNRLILNVQPDEGIGLSIHAKKPGPKLCVGDLLMQFKFKNEDGMRMPDAYERLLLDIMLGDQTLFVRSDAMAEGWKLLDPVLKDWASENHKNGLYFYEAGSEGPPEASELIESDGRSWRKL